MFKRPIIFLTFFFILLSACTSPASDSPKPDSAIVASTTFLADIARNIAGSRLEIVSLLPTGTDPHSYQPAPQDVARIERAPLIILNGADYEHFLEPLLENAEAQVNVVEASTGITPRVDATGEHGIDPHMWLDPNLVIIYVENIRIALTKYDPAGAAEYQKNADDYTSQLKDLNAWIIEQVAQIPDQQRILVTNHEALNYFADQYGFEVAGSVIPGFSTNASPSAQEMATLIDKVNKSNVPAIFLDAADNDTLAKQIADETGVQVVTDLYLESLTDNAPAGTYINMMMHNVTRIVESLK